MNGMPGAFKNLCKGVVLLLLTVVTAYAQTPLDTGKGVFEFSGHPALKGKAMRIFYYRPNKGNVRKMPILFVMHGVQRNADSYRDNWVELSERYKVLVVVPEFSSELFPKSRMYNYGNLLSRDGTVNPEEEWSYSLIDPIFDHVVRMTGSKAKHYDLFGHSAGAQFAHRFFLFKQGTKARCVVAANAGSYTMLDLNVDFPFGLKDMHFDDERLNRALGRKLVIQLGEEDTDSAHPNLNVSKEAMRQGEHRLERGVRFFETAQQLAVRLRTDFNWKVRRVPGVAHENDKMAVDIAQYLYESRDTGR